MCDSRRVGQCAIGAAQCQGNVRVGLAKTFDMHLIQHQLTGLYSRCLVSVEDMAGGHARFQGVACVVGGIQRKAAVRMPQLIAMVLGTPLELAHDFACTRIEQQFVGIKAVAPLGLKRPVGAQAVNQAHPASGHKSMEHTVVRSVQRQSFDLAFACGIEQAQLNALGVT